MNVLGCNDQFFNTFINILAFVTSFIIAYLNNEVPGKMGINYYMCTGEDPRDYKYLGPKVTCSFFYHKPNKTFTSPKMFCAGPNVLSQPKTLTAFSASSKTFVPAQKPILLNANLLSGTKCL